MKIKLTKKQLSQKLLAECFFESGISFDDLAERYFGKPRPRKRVALDLIMGALFIMREGDRAKELHDLFMKIGPIRAIKHFEENGL